MKQAIILISCTLLFSCSEKQPTYEEEFNLQRFRVDHYDLYNPISNTFKLDSTARKEYPDFYKYDAYFDDKDTLRYAFYRSDSYGYLQEFNYNAEGRISWVKIYPILASSVHKSENISSVFYFYKNGELKLVKDAFSNELILLNDITATVYTGVLGLEATSKEFNIFSVQRRNYYVTLMH